MNLAVAVTLLIRRKNTIDFDLDEDEDIDESDESNNEDVIEKPQSIDYSDEIEGNRGIENGNKVEDSAERRRPHINRPKKRTFDSDENVTTVKKRKVATGNLNKDGPIMKTKRDCIKS